jgi:hypothetical protein
MYISVRGTQERNKVTCLIVSGKGPKKSLALDLTISAYLANADMADEYLHTDFDYRRAGPPLTVPGVSAANSFQDAHSLLAVYPMTSVTPSTHGTCQCRDENSYASLIPIQWQDI